MPNWMDEINEVWSLKKGDSLDLWWELVAEIARLRRGGEAGAVAARALKEISRRHGLYFLNAQSRMSAAIKPLIDGDAEALAVYGLFPKKRTACGLADAAADLYNAVFEADRHIRELQLETYIKELENARANPN
jgi:hypothetical protein